VATEASTHSPWASRIWDDHGHEVLVNNQRKVRLIYGEGRKTDRIDALRSWHGWPARPQAALANQAPRRDLPALPAEDEARQLRVRGTVKTFGGARLPPNAWRRVSTKTSPNSCRGSA